MFLQQKINNETQLVKGKSPKAGVEFRAYF